MSSKSGLSHNQSNTKNSAELPATMSRKESGELTRRLKGKYGPEVSAWRRRKK